MSIFASLASPDDGEHEDHCEIWVKHDDYWDIGDNPCSCGQPNSPIIYQGSHVLPEESDPRGGHVDIALIPPHVRFWRENPNASIEDEPDYKPEPFLRFGVNEGTVILTRAHVQQIVNELNEWLTQTSKG